MTREESIQLALQKAIDSIGSTLNAAGIGRDACRDDFNEVRRQLMSLYQQQAQKTGKSWID